MPAERTVACPHCGATRSTKAGAGTKLTCPGDGCGKLYRAPAPTAAEPTAAVVPASSSSSEPADEETVGGVTIVRSTKGTKVPQRARPRPRKGSTGPKRSTPPPAEPPPAPLEHPQTRRAKVTGARRRGGVALYREMVGRGR